MNEPTDAHCPVVEMTTRSKLSCLSWNKYAKNQIASSDYEGIVTVWDVTTRKVIVTQMDSFSCIICLSILVYILAVFHSFLFYDYCFPLAEFNGI